MNRIWSIKEQTYHDVNTRLRFEFTSAHTVAGDMDLPAPASDETLILRVYNESGTRILTLTALRNGNVIASTVEPNISGQVPRSDQEKAREGVVVRDDPGYNKEAAAAADDAVAKAKQAKETAILDTRVAYEREQSGAGLMNRSTNFAGDIE